MSMTDQKRAASLLARRADPPSAMRSILAQGRFRIPVAVGIALMIWLCYSLGGEKVGAGLVGLWFGALLRDVRFAFEVERVWPFTERVIDWEKVQDLASGK
jgi:hypothetical protein